MTAERSIPSEEGLGRHSHKGRMEAETPRTQPSEAGWGKGREEERVKLCKPGTGSRRRAGETASKEGGFHAMVTADFILLSFHHPITLF